ncbi:HET domain-containing protein [Fusarium sp. LHS14.1]|nr:HET domain-containing protein [Fusarium sp. LHS14.1]
MAQIYTHCRRVLVYLGRDSFHPTSPNVYPGRQLLEHHMTSQQVRELLLGMRYFSRIWIFQEMILPKQVTMPLGDLELWADHMTGGKLASLREEPVPTPWMVHIAQGRNPNKNTFELVRDTWTMQASDPRDRLFGVLALSSDGDAFQPDYSLSCRHISGASSPTISFDITASRFFPTQLVSPRQKATHLGCRIGRHSTFLRLLLRKTSDNSRRMPLIAGETGCSKKNIIITAGIVKIIDR